MTLLGGVEAGGTKFICGVGAGPESLHAVEFPTTTPGETSSRVIAFFKEHPVDAIGIGSFGPVDLRAGSPSYGHITTTPKLAWRHFDLLGTVQRGTGARIAFDTDVNAAAAGEHRWGAGQGLDNFIYLTVGTGVGGGAVVNGRLVHGLIHPEMGHIRIPHDWTKDPYPDTKQGCPSHGDCLEGLASGSAMEERWGMPGSLLPPEHQGWDLEADYLAAGLATWICTLSPQRIILGGGVMKHLNLFPRIRKRVGELLNEYVQAPEILERIDEYIVPPGLGGRAGILGAIALAGSLG